MSISACSKWAEPPGPQQGLPHALAQLCGPRAAQLAPLRGSLQVDPVLLAYGRWPRGPSLGHWPSAHGDRGSVLTFGAPEDVAYLVTGIALLCKSKCSSIATPVVAASVGHKISCPAGASSLTHQPAAAPLESLIAGAAISVWFAHSQVLPHVAVVNVRASCEVVRGLQATAASKPGIRLAALFVGLVTSDQVEILLSIIRIRSSQSTRRETRRTV